MKTIFVISLFLAITGNIIRAQSVTLTPQGNTLTQFSLSTTSDISQTGTPTISQLIYNTNAAITGSNANGIGYYYWNGANWQSLDANIPSGTIVFSETHPNQALINAGFQFLTTTTTQVPALNEWVSINLENNPLENQSLNPHPGKAKFAFTFGNKFYIWYEKRNEIVDNTNYPPIYKVLPKVGKIYNPLTDVWSNIDTLNSPNESSGLYIKMKDRIIFSKNGVLKKIYNPITNLWSDVSGLDAPSSFSVNNQSKESSNYLFNWNGQSGIIFDAISNTWVNVSSFNAPVKSNFQGQIDIRLNDIYSFITYNEYEVGNPSNVISESYILNLQNNLWNAVTTVNKPNYISIYSYPENNAWQISGFKGDTLWLRKTNGDNVSPDTVSFKKYLISDNLFIDDTPQLFVSKVSLSALNFLFKGFDGSLYFDLPDFTGFGKDKVEIFKLKNDVWEYKSYNTFGRVVDYEESKKILCGEKLIFTGGGLNGYTPIFHDYLVVDLKNEESKVIRSPFEKLAMSNTCCSANYLLSFSGYILNSISSGSNKYLPSGLMNLPNISNSQTSKVFYLYKKN
jgi:hypothetical protein